MNKIDNDFIGLTRGRSASPEHLQLTAWLWRLGGGALMAVVCVFVAIATSHTASNAPSPLIANFLGSSAAWVRGCAVVIALLALQWVGFCIVQVIRRVELPLRKG